MGAVYLTNFLSSWGMELWCKLTSSSLETVNLNKVFILSFRFIDSQGKGSPDLWVGFLSAHCCVSELAGRLWQWPSWCSMQCVYTEWIPGLLSVWGGLWEPLFVTECLFCISLPVLRAWVSPCRWRQDVEWVVMKNLRCLPDVSSYLWFLYLLLVEIICLSPTSGVGRN